MNSPLSSEVFDLLRATNTPTIANAIELLSIRDRMAGFTRGKIQRVCGGPGPILGFAVTVKIRSAQKPTNPISLRAYWDHIANIPGPRIVVVQDLDQPSGGAWWGEVNSNIHRALGCIGLVTDGTVRDLDEVRPLGFQFFAAGIAVSHGYAHPVEFNTPVTVDGMAVQPSELIHADGHGAISIPVDEAVAVLKAVAAVERYERPILQLCKSTDFSSARLEEMLQNKIV
jgi:4-hydroxy-4-methyl-2-oxoglutarate aldolase